MATGQTSLNWVHYGAFAVAVLLLLGSFTWFAPKDVPTVKYPSAEEIASKVAPLVQVQPLDNTEVLKAIDNLNIQVSEDDDWEIAAETLATEEWSEKDYKAIFDFIDDEYGDVDDREDVIYVKVKESDVSDADVDDKDAFVTQEVKVKYEDESGEDRVRYLLIETQIEDGVVEVQDISED